MKNLLENLRRSFADSLAKLTEKSDEFAQLVRPAQDPKFGDYQANCAMPLRKELGGNPRDIAQKIVDGLPNQGAFASLEIAGPGFINLRIADSFLADRLREALVEPEIRFVASRRPGTMIVDYSSPNVAKPMHVGHLRSTIIGDAIARLNRALGWKVITDNHLGDWGTQFGMLIYGWRNFREEGLAEQNPLAELARLYRTVNELQSNDPDVARACRDETAKLHEGDSENVRLWETFMPWCMEDLRRVYDRLGISFDFHYGESFYQPMLADVVEELKKTGLAVESQGATCLFFPDPDGKVDDDGKPIQQFAPFIIRKADGAFTYATTDLATVQYRFEHFKPDVVVYVVDDRQAMHFQQLFATARRWGYDHARLEHVAFGKIMGPDGKPFRTREGGTVGLETLLDEAVTRAREVVDRESAHLPDDERQRIAEVVGIGAVKYADLSQNRLSDYVFDWDKMISMQGNTAAYLQYAYARNRSIFRKGEIDPTSLSADPPEICLEHPSERSLGLALLRYPEAVDYAGSDYRPNLLTNHLFELANAYSAFWRDCPVLKAESDSLKRSRLALCELTARVLEHGLDLLGIDVADRM